MGDHHSQPPQQFHVYPFQPRLKVCRHVSVRPEIRQDVGAGIQRKIFPIIQAGSRDVARDKAASHSSRMQASLLAIATSHGKALAKNADVHNFVKKQSTQKSGDHDVGINHLDDSTVFASCSEDEKLQCWYGDSRLNNHSTSSPFPTQPSFKLGKQLLICYHDLHCSVKWKKGANGGRLISLD